MLSLVRNGSRSIYITTKDMNKLVNFLETSLDAEEMDTQLIQDRSREYQTLVFLSDHELDFKSDRHLFRSFMISQEPISILSKIISYNTDNFIESIRPGANLVIMRSVGDLDQILLEIQKDLGGEIVQFDKYIENDNSDYTIVGLTDKPLSRGILAREFNQNFLMLHGEYGKIKRALRMKALHYLNIGIGKRDWNEVEIRVYDKFGAYSLQYDRLMDVFDDLEIGLILGESWSKDYPKAMLSVEVYRIRFFTFEDPASLKNILMALEYLDDGTRIVDYDLYCKNEKLSWLSDIKRRDRFKTDRVKEALKARENLVASLAEDTIRNMKFYEEEILKTRY